MTINYTSRDGGDRLRRAANKVAQRNFPGAGWRFFDVRYGFPELWNMFQRAVFDVFKKEHEHKHDAKTCSWAEIYLQFNCNMFPFLTGHREISIYDPLATVFDCG